MKKILLILLIIFLSNINVNAQKLSKKGQKNEFGKDLFSYSIGIFPSQYSDSFRVDFLFKLNIELLPFINKQQDIKNNQNFNSNIEIELKDSTGIIRNRIKIDVNGNHSITNGLNSCLILNKSITIKSAYYDAKVKLYIDNKLKRVIKTEITTNFVKEVFPSKILFTELSNVDTYSPFILNEAIKLSSINPYIIFPLPQNTSKVNYIIHNVKDEYSINLWEKDLEFKGVANVKTTNGLQLLTSGDYKLYENSDYNIGFINISDKLMKEGKYRITLLIDNKSMEYGYQIKWEHKPKSMYNIDYAMKLMYYILPVNKYDSLMSLKKSDKIRSVNEYWLSLEEEGAFFSSRQVTYFQRADEASQLYSTPKYADGALTKRGEIYILFGKPDEISTQIIKKVFTETWIYEKLNEKYVFEMATPGEYKLIRIEKI